MSNVFEDLKVSDALSEYSPRALRGMSPAALEEIGATEEDQKKIRAAIELGRLLFTPSDHSLPVECSQDVYDQNKDLATESFEQFRVCLLDSKNKIVAQKTVSMGDTNECHVKPCQVFTYALQNACTRIVLVHNHPSGDHGISPSDLALTKRLRDGATILGIDILDHVVVAGVSYTSMRDKGVL
jgi:DNA repair protein RadC